MTGETKTLIGVLAGTVVLVLAGAWFFGGGGSTGQQTGGVVANAERLVQADSPFQGPEDAQVTVVEFGDFECPACGSLHPTLQQVKEQNKENSVRFVYRQFPLTRIHPLAQEAAEASLAAGAQGKFWEYHDLLFENQPALERADLVSYAEQLELDVEAFTAALDDGTFEAHVARDVSDGTAVGVPGTPAVYVNGVQYSGAYSVLGLQAAIDSALAVSSE